MSKLPSRVFRRMSRHRVPWILLLVAAAGLFAWWPSQPAEGAGVGGYAEVVRLETAYRPADDVLEARFHFSSGVALTQTVKDSADIDRLLQMATAFGSDNVKMFATAHEDQIQSWHLSVR